MVRTCARFVDQSWLAHTLYNTQPDPDRLVSTQQLLSAWPQQCNARHQSVSILNRISDCAVVAYPGRLRQTQ